MNHPETHEIDYGTGQKKLGIYVAGVIICTLLTLLAFWTVMSGRFTKWEMFSVIYTAACVQFVVQLVCFIRLNTQTEKGRTNVMTFVFTGVILTCIIIGTLWIMRNLNYNMMH